MNYISLLVALTLSVVTTFFRVSQNEEIIDNGPIEEEDIYNCVIDSKEPPKWEPHEMEIETRDSFPPEEEFFIEADLKSRVIKVYDGDKETVFEGLEWSRVGIGNKLGSRRTPVGEFNLTKEPDHRFGGVLRLNGFQGWERGILIHKHMDSRFGTNGCLCLDRSKMNKLFNMVPDRGAKLKIKYDRP